MSWNRRQVLAATAAMGLTPLTAGAEERKMISRPIPSTGEDLPVLGLGTYDVEVGLEASRAHVVGSDAGLGLEAVEDLAEDVRLWSHVRAVNGELAQFRR